MEKKEVVRVLREMADLLEVAEANSFEVMAYRNGAQSLDEWSGDLQAAVEQDTLRAVPSVGKGLAQVISDLIKRGESEEHQRIRAFVPEGLPPLFKIRGLGPKRIRTLWQQLGVENSTDLRRAAADGSIQALRGFGAKTVERIVAGLDYLEQPAKAASSPRHIHEVRMPESSASAGRVLAGMSGFSYPQWKGNFYSADAKTGDLLEHYSKRFQTVEINNTFYRFPSEKVVQQWLSQTPAHFRFAIKAHRRITHQLRLGPKSERTIVEFVERCGQLGEKLGSVLFQLPPDFKRDDDRLSLLLRSLPAGPRYAVEFRHQSWLEEIVFDRLREQNVGIVAGDADDQAAFRQTSADFSYVRLRRTAYDESELDAWQAWFEKQSAAKRDVLAYFKHDDSGDMPEAVAARWGIDAAKSTRKVAKSTQRTRKARKTGA